MKIVKSRKRGDCMTCCLSTLTGIDYEKLPLNTWIKDYNLYKELLSKHNMAIKYSKKPPSCNRYMKHYQYEIKRKSKFSSKVNNKWVQAHTTVVINGKEYDSYGKIKPFRSEMNKMVKQNKAIVLYAEIIRYYPDHDRWYFCDSSFEDR